MAVPRHVVFGTAGHVDHGKSSLVRALTGTDPDRLAEEKAREMTIDLGFAFLPLPGLDEPVAIVDVPGHEMFVRTMVAGATGLDAVLFVVAADEAVRPQTIEHLRVLCELRIPTGLIALTKADKVAPSQLAAAADEVRALVAGTFLEQAPLVPVSVVTGAGLPELRAHMAEVARTVRTRDATGPFRLPVDRAFVMRGAGTVVTGTVISGQLRVGERVALLPADQLLRVRALQVQGKRVEEVAAGQRAAINLAGIEKSELGRGDVLVTPGAFAPSFLLDARVELAAEANYKLAQRTRVRLHHGTAEVMARVILLEGDELLPGTSTSAHLRLEAPLVAAAGDPFVLRTYSPMRVVGGGVITDAHPRKRRPSQGTTGMRDLNPERPDRLVAQLLKTAGSSSFSEAELQVRGGLSPEGLQEALTYLRDNGEVVAGRGHRWYCAEAIEEVSRAMVTALEQLHQAKPHWTYAPLSSITDALVKTPEQREAVRLALARLSDRGIIDIKGERLRLAAHTTQWPAQLARIREAVLSQLRQAGLASPSVVEMAQAAGASGTDCREVLEALVEAGEVIALAPGIFVNREVVSQARERVVAFLQQHGQMSIGEARDLLGISRKYLLPLLEMFDRAGITQRRGDVRVRGAKAGQSPVV